MTERAAPAGYDAAGGRLDPARLRWFRTCGEIFCLAQPVRPDRVNDDLFDDACCRIETLCLEAVQ